MLKTIISCVLAVALSIGATCPRALATDEGSIETTLNAALSEKGPFYLWSLEEKAVFYDQHVYHGVGTRRGVPDARHIQPEIIKANAPVLLAACLNCGEDELFQYTIDLDFWIDAFPNDPDREHEFYSVCFLLVDSAQEKPHNVYQLQISAYTGELVEAIHLESEWTWHKATADETLAE